MNNTSLTAIKRITRSQATASALASVRAEGLQPTEAALKRLEQYVKGTITADQLRKATLVDVQMRAGRIDNPRS